jgi:hypothetical protein
VDLTGGTNSTEERKTGKKATQYSPRTTQTKTATAAELYRAAARQISSRLHWMWAENSRTNQKPNPSSSNNKKRTTLREVEKWFFSLKLKKDYTWFTKITALSSSLIWLLKLKN